MDLSIVIPSIRIDRWPILLESIAESCKRHTYEVIFVGPNAHSCINGTSVNQNIKFVRDLGNPNRCQHIGALVAEGLNIHFGSDDCLYTPDSIDAAMDLLNQDDVCVVTANYKEGGNTQGTLKLLNCYGNNKRGEVKDDWVIFNVPFMKYWFYYKYGGFDCRYQTTCWGHADLAARVQRFPHDDRPDMIKTLNTDVLECTHMPGTTGDHAPVHHAFTEDQQMFYHKPIGMVTMHDWRKVPSVWEKRWD